MIWLDVQQSKCFRFNKFSSTLRMIFFFHLHDKNKRAARLKSYKKHHRTIAAIQHCIHLTTYMDFTWKSLEITWANSHGAITRRDLAWICKKKISRLDASMKTLHLPDCTKIIGECTWTCEKIRKMVKSLKICASGV